MIVRGGIEDTRLEAKDTKKSKGKAKDRPSRGQGQECSRPRTQRGSDLKTKIFAQNFINFPKNSGVIQRKKSSSLKTFVNFSKIQAFSRKTNVVKNQSKGKFITAFKKVKVIPVFKTGCHNDVANYRPISLLPVTSKFWKSKCIS